MAVVTSTFSIPANTSWASTTWSIANDPSGKVHTQLNNWVTAINDTSLIELLANPGTATSRTASSYVTWRLRMRSAGDTSSDYGILFKGRYAGTASTSASGYNGSYNSWFTSTSNNGYGTYNNLSDTTSNESFTTDSTVITAYEATGNLQWFSYAWENNARSARQWDCLMRCDTTNMVSGSYYPSSGLGKWIYIKSVGNAAYIVTPQNSLSVGPFKGVNTAGARVLRHPTPTTTNYFFRLGAQYGDLHYLGDITNDFLASNTSTGQFGDTVVIDSVTYTCLGNMPNASNIWMKTSA